MSAALFGYSWHVLLINKTDQVIDGINKLTRNINWSLMALRYQWCKRKPRNGVVSDNPS